MFTLNRFNNTIVNKRRNPREDFKKNNLSATSGSAPFRMPFNHYRRVTYCPDSNCKTNQKVFQDTLAFNLGNNKCLCYDPTIKSFLNKNGIPEHSFIFNGSNVLYKNKKNLEQNTVSKIVSSIPVNGDNVYKGSYENPNNPNNKLQEPCHNIVHKITNYTTQKVGATSQKNRINRLRYNNTTARNSYNNYGQCKNTQSNCYNTLNKHVKSFPMMCRKRRINKKEVCLKNNN